MANALAFIWGGYYTLTPIFFATGFIAIAVISAWASIEWQTKDLIVIAVSALFLSFIDEYAHTSIGTIAYFDEATPSLLTVFGWSIFMTFLVATTKSIANIPWLHIEDHRKLRSLPVIVSLVLLIAIIVQGYLSIFNWVIFLVYFLLFVASFYYTSVHHLKWNIIMMAVSLVFGLCMEYVGGMEGLWTFRSQYPISLLILFSWPLRLWTVNAFCLVVGVDFSSHYEKSALSPSTETAKAQTSQ